MALKTNELIELSDKISQQWVERMNELAEAQRQVNESPVNSVSNEIQTISVVIPTENNS